MNPVKALLLKPLDGHPEGSEREFDRVDFDRLKDMGAVREADTGGKAASEPLNKMASQPVNKAEGSAQRKTARG